MPSDSRGYYLLRAEAIVSRWRLPMVAAPFIDRPLRATAVSAEGRYKVLPGLYAAIRVDRLGFSTVMGSAGPQEWDAPVTRIEVGGGYSLQRNLLLKMSYQFDKRNGTRIPRSHLACRGGRVLVLRRPLTSRAVIHAFVGLACAAGIIEYRFASEPAG